MVRQTSCEAVKANIPLFSVWQYARFELVKDHCTTCETSSAIDAEGISRNTGSQTWPDDGCKCCQCNQSCGSIDWAKMAKHREGCTMSRCS